MTPIRQANRAVAVGLLEIIPQIDLERTDEASYPHLRWMVERVIDGVDCWPMDKVGRWIGFVQGVLHLRGVHTCYAERERTRPIFYEAYQSEGVEIPPTQERI